MRKKMLMFVATVFTCLGINTLCAAEQVVEKRYHDCHKAVYGRAELPIYSGISVASQESNSAENLAMLKNGGPQYVVVGTVPVQKVHPIHKVKFKDGIFTIKHTGTYIIEYFLKAFTDISISGPVTIGIRINKNLEGIRKLNPVNSFSKFFEGNGVLIKNLNKGDKVSLEVISLPAVSVGHLNDDSTDGHLAMFKNGDVYYANSGDLSIPDIGAYLMIHKAEQDD